MSKGSFISAISCEILLKDLKENSIELRPVQTRMRDDESWQSRIVTGNILSVALKNKRMSVLTMFSLQ